MVIKIKSWLRFSNLSTYLLYKTTIVLSFDLIKWKMIKIVNINHMDETIISGVQLYIFINDIFSKFWMHVICSDVIPIGLYVNKFWK